MRCTFANILHISLHYSASTCAKVSLHVKDRSLQGKHWGCQKYEQESTGSVTPYHHMLLHRSSPAAVMCSALSWA